MGWPYFPYYVVCGIYENEDNLIQQFFVSPSFFSLETANEYAILLGSMFEKPVEQLNNHFDWAAGCEECEARTMLCCQNMAVNNVMSTAPGCYKAVAGAYESVSGEQFKRIECKHKKSVTYIGKLSFVFAVVKLAEPPKSAIFNPDELKILPMDETYEEDTETNDETNTTESNE